MDEMVVDELKKYILSDFRDEKHKRDSLVDIFRKDRNKLMVENVLHGR